MSEQPMPPGPGPQHEQLKTFEGTFRAVVKLWMGPGDPMVATGTMTNTMQLDGRFLHQDYVGDASEGPFPRFVGKGYWGFNDAIGKYEGFWIDNASNIMQTDVGTVDDAGKAWTMIGEFPSPATGAPMRKRTVIRYVDHDHHSVESFFGPEGEEQKTMEIEYERA